MTHEGAEIAVLGSLYMLRYIQASADPENAARRSVTGSVAVLIVAGLLFAMPNHLQHVPSLSRLSDVAINPLGTEQIFHDCSARLLRAGELGFSCAHSAELLPGGRELSRMVGVI